MNSKSSLPTPDADAAAHSARLVAHVRDEIAAAGGWIGFDRYMGLVLYAPGLGYYTAGAHKLGDAARGGDFVTAPEISPLFGRTLAAQVDQVLRLLGDGQPQVLEFGAGSGRLARDLLDGLAARGVSARYAIVEVSADLRARQQQLLAGRDVIWLDAPPSQFEGVIVANEVLDVMPVRLFALRDGAVFERGVAWVRSLKNDALGFVEREAPPDLIDAVGEIESHAGLPAGYGSELGFTARGWMRSAGDWLARGVLFAIDYGFPRHEYYHPQRLMGTIMCHYRHHAHADPFWWPGLNDLTAHVDFTAMAEAAFDAGLRVLGYTSQARFLINCGLLDVVQRGLPQPDGARRAAEAQRLLSEAEMGELFKVLAVGRGVDPPLLGFASGDRLHAL